MNDNCKNGCENIFFESDKIGKKQNEKKILSGSPTSETLKQVNSDNSLLASVATSLYPLDLSHIYSIHPKT